VCVFLSIFLHTYLQTHILRIKHTGKNKKSGIPIEERTIPSTGVDADFFAEQGDVLSTGMTRDQCQFFRTKLKEAIDYLVPKHTRSSEQMIDFSFLFTIAKDCEPHPSCTTGGEKGCFLLEPASSGGKPIQVSVSIIDYLNNFNTFKQFESNTGIGNRFRKFHRYNEYTEKFIESLCDPENSREPSQEQQNKKEEKAEKEYSGTQSSSNRFLQKNKLRKK
jgi:hypothetical protein